MDQCTRMQIVWYAVILAIAMPALTDAQCSAGQYTQGGGTANSPVRRYPPAPKTLYAWSIVTDLLNTLTVSASNSNAAYGSGTYTVTGSSFSAMGANNKVGNVFDYNVYDDYDTGWYTIPSIEKFDSNGVYTGSSSKGGVSGAWIVIQFPSPIVLTSYTINPNLVLADVIVMPQKWTVLGSTDGQTWTTLHTIDYTTSSLFAWYAGAQINTQYMPVTSTLFSYYALVMQKRGAGPTYYGVYINEWSPTGYEVVTSSVCVACTNGTYNYAGSATSCSACTNGNAYSTYTGPGTTATNCPVSCAPSTYMTNGACTLCPTGMFSAGGSAPSAPTGTPSADTLDRVPPPQTAQYTVLPGRSTPAASAHLE